VELAGWLRLSGYDVVWTQWPEMGRPLLSFWRAARMSGLRVVHTAHNVFPHERREGDYNDFKVVYDNARLIITHSDMATRTLRENFPAVAGKVTTSRLGLYSSYPRRPQARAELRSELAIPPDRCIVLAFGSVRPYKNLDVLLDAMAADTEGKFTLVVAGHEFGYPNLDPRDRLGMTRRRVADLGLGDHVRLLPGPTDNERTADLFELADVVALPYAESYGSGVLLLGMSFGKPIVASRTGGMDEYLAVYRDGVLVEPDVNATQLLAALSAAWNKALAAGDEAPRPRELEWSQIVRKLLPDLARVIKR
jgi:glycosyltransferase involved in cell wall biosynthesis